ncbi:MAG: stage II sporulation protein E (SpoIIE) [Actinobacteria bacterium]|nr:MAG: stage II sporulation protein E (SpoIIE) [Actinomycetota bacterium]
MPHERALLEWGVAAWTLAGQGESGDLAVVVSFPDGMLAAVVDGLGHGPEAARAARAAARVLRKFPGERADRLVERAHDLLKETRGVVMTLAHFNGTDDTLTWMGVGNVQALLASSAGRGDGGHRTLAPQGGIVGYRLPKLSPASIPIAPGDVLIAVTDGVRSDFDQPSDLSRSPKELAGQILEAGKKGTDDALVLVARYLGNRG